LNGLNIILIGGLHLVIILGLSFYYLIHFRFKEAIMVWRAIYWNLSHLPSLVRKRRKVQKIRTVTDKEVFRYILKPVDWQEMFGHFLRSERMLAGKHEI